MKITVIKMVRYILGVHVGFIILNTNFFVIRRDRISFKRGICCESKIKNFNLNSGAI